MCCIDAKLSKDDGFTVIMEENFPTVEVCTDALQGKGLHNPQNLYGVHQGIYISIANDKGDGICIKNLHSKHSMASVNL